MPLTPLTCAWPPSFPSVPTSRATRVTSSANEPSWSTISLTVLPIAANSPLTGWPSIVSAIFCDRSPRATDWMTREISVVGRTRSSIIELTDSTVSLHVPSTVPNETRSVIRPSRPMMRATRASSLAWRALIASSSLQRCWISPMASRRRARRRTLKSPSRAAVRTRSSSSRAGSSGGSPSWASRPLFAVALRPAGFAPVAMLPDPQLVARPQPAPRTHSRPGPNPRLARHAARASVDRERRMARPLALAPPRRLPPPGPGPQAAARAVDPERRPSPPACHASAAPTAPGPLHGDGLRPRRDRPDDVSQAREPAAVARGDDRQRRPAGRRRRAAPAQPRALRGRRDGLHVAVQDELGAARRRRAHASPAPERRLSDPLRQRAVRRRAAQPAPAARAAHEGRRCRCSTARCACIYGSWFLPHVLLGYALLRHPEYVPRAAGRLAASYHLTTPFYWFVPTAPPWWASEVAGRMDGDVQRVVRRVVCRVLTVRRPARTRRCRATRGARCPPTTSPRRR